MCIIIIGISLPGRKSKRMGYFFMVTSLFFSNGRSKYTIFHPTKKKLFVVASKVFLDHIGPLIKVSLS